MTQRLDYFKQPSAREPLLALSALSGYLRDSDLDPVLMELIQLRASQLNGCAFCVDMHTKDLAAAGEDGARVYLLTTWREANVHSLAERAALAWTEALTRLDSGADLNACYTELAMHFSTADILNITFTVVAINSWNRLSVGFGKEPGAYRPGDLDGSLKKALQVLRH
ncbi:carboxymuconolactone decarboxylase family protein [Kineobactrum salinum]|uniref:Carboxymuconolactone decarboxylase family protein n=1 Tax=Kineobactrum salinum TaxID=2708301 RepID=A0A6C0U3F5_9GAMM|nr:carboxymuconolactone decarboxylase family protein [Kineobactrum salinum]QIB64895.1 carboxymuconolactone decarboxylase family protein [Kineobactrum salinum]